MAYWWYRYSPLSLFSLYFCFHSHAWLFYAVQAKHSLNVSGRISSFITNNRVTQWKTRRVQDQISSQKSYFILKTRIRGILHFFCIISTIRKEHFPLICHIIKLKRKKSCCNSSSTRRGILQITKSHLSVNNLNSREKSMYFLVFLFDKNKFSNGFASA